MPLSGIKGVGKKQRKVGIRVNVHLVASLPGPLGFLHGPWAQVHGGSITGADFAAWPYRISLLCKRFAFLGTLQWPADTGSMGHY